MIGFFCAFTWSGDDDGLPRGVVGFADVVEGHDPQLVLLPSLEATQHGAVDVCGVDVVSLEHSSVAFLRLDVLDPKVLVHAAMKAGAPRQVH